MTAIAVGPLGIRDAAIAADLHGRSTADGWTETAWATLVADPLSIGFLARVGSDPAGLVLARTAADEAEILMLAVTACFRRRGIGALLLAHALAGAAARGATKAFLEVADDNLAAISLYRAAGFVDAGLRTGYYATPGGRRDALVLARALSLDAPGRDS